MIWQLSPTDTDVRADGGGDDRAANRSGQREDQQHQSGGRDDLAEQMPCREAVFRGESRGRFEHEIRQDCAAHPATDLGEKVDDDLARPVGGAEEPVGERDNGVEVRPADGLEDHDEHS